MPLLHIGGYEWLDWHLHPDVLLLVLGLEAAYLYAVTYLRQRVTDVGRVKRSQVVTFSLGVLVLYVGAGTPIHDLSERYLLSAHMFQHLLFTMVAAPLLLAGTPAWLWQALLQGPRVTQVARVLTHPLLAFAVFNATLLLTHLPPAVDLSLRHHFFHLFVHSVLVGTALLMWWPVISSVPELPAISYPSQMAYLFLQSLLPAVMASFITFSDSVVYSFYGEAPRIWGISPIADQQIAGGLMKLLGTMILWSFMTVVFFKWYGLEEAEARGPRWSEVQEELDRLGLKTHRQG
ncbi:MAG: cytochrome c oxidase assembly protein [Chloroflexi bacterium]|nr:cytochrome c oxidase assembly protein [Chloroflexota bacterium]